MRLKRILGVTLAMGMVLCSVPSNVKATEISALNNVDKAEEFDLEKQPGYMGNVEQSDFKDLPTEVINSFDSGRRKNLSRAVVAGDAYEPNNNVSLATNYMKGKLVNANIHNNTDVDFYKFDVTSDDVSNATTYSFVLTNIPSQCDYDMYVADSSLQAVADIKQGSTSEQMLLTFNKAGTYYVLIRSSDNTYNASANYKLYFGPTYKNGSTGWKSTGFKFNFPNKNAGVDEKYLWSTTGWLVYDGLRTDTSIPTGSLVKEFDLDAEGTGTWGGFYKRIIPAANQDVMYQQLGGIDAIDMPAGQYAVKQQWAINGIINYAYSFIWKPNICVDYTYPVIIQNMSFVR